MQTIDHDNIVRMYGVVLDKDNALMLVRLLKFFMLFCRLLIFFKINSFDNFFQEYRLSVKQIGTRSGPTFCQA